MKFNRVDEITELRCLAVGELLLVNGEVFLIKISDPSDPKAVISVLVGSENDDGFNLDAYPSSTRGTLVTITNVEYTS